MGFYVHLLLERGLRSPVGRAHHREQPRGALGPGLKVATAPSCTRGWRAFGGCHGDGCPQQLDKDVAAEAAACVCAGERCPRQLPSALPLRGPQSHWAGHLPHTKTGWEPAEFSSLCALPGPGHPPCSKSLQLRVPGRPQAFQHLSLQVCTMDQMRQWSTALGGRHCHSPWSQRETSPLVIRTQVVY